MTCQCSVKGQCSMCHEVDLYNAGIQAGYLKRQSEIKISLGNIIKIIDDISALLSRGSR